MSLGQTQREVGLLSSDFDAPFIKFDLWVDALDTHCCRDKAMF